MIGKARASAPSSWRSCSIVHARSRSVRPVNGCSARRSYARSVIAAARRIASSSSGSFTARSPSVRPVVGTSSSPPARSVSHAAYVTWSASNRIRPDSCWASAATRLRLTSTNSAPAEVPSLLGVAEVGEDADAVGLDEHGRVRAREAGQVADVDEVRDEQRPVARAPAGGRSVRSRGSLLRGTRAPRGTPPRPCRRSGGRARLRGRRAAATPRARPRSTGAPRPPAPSPPRARRGSPTSSASTPPG